MKQTLLLATIALALAAPAAAQQHGRAGTHHAPYAGQDKQAVSSLSDGDVAALSAGAGWGLAKPAEFNGFPGPLHVLELAERIGLSSDQRAKVEQLYDRMKSRAIPAGADYIAAERALDAAFRSGAIDSSILAARLAAAEAARAKLRAVHLEAHLDTVPLLTPNQRQTYNQLRGYGTGGHGNHRHH